MLKQSLYTYYKKKGKSNRIKKVIEKFGKVYFQALYQNRSVEGTNKQQQPITETNNQVNNKSATKY